MMSWEGIWFPDGEKHLPEWMAKVGHKRGGVYQYQFHKYQTAMRWVRRQRRVAVDVGAHVGQWSRNMALDFRHVHCFEPVPRYQECWGKNLDQHPNATLYRHGLGAVACRVDMICGTPGSHGDTFVNSGGRSAGDVVAEDVPIVPLDELGLDEVDFVKIDCEGYEENVIRGAERTIRKWKPCVIVEQKPGHSDKFGLRPRGAVDRLMSWGAKLRSEISGDYILSW